MTTQDNPQPSTAEDSAARIDDLLAETKRSLRPGLDDNVQEELAAILGLLPYLRRSDYSHLIGVAEIAILALLSDPPNLKLAQEARQRLSHQIRPLRNPFAAVLRGGTPPTRVILGLGTLLYLAIPMLLTFLPGFLDQKYIAGIESQYFLVVAFAGAIGSIVSIMVRIQDFSGLHDVDPAVLFFTGFFKPMVGASFALFVFSALKAGIIPVTVNEEAELYFFMAFSFVAGFSERFAKDIVKTTERRIGGPDGGN